MDVNPNDLQEMVTYIEQSQPLLTKQAETEAKVAQLAPTVVDALIKAGHVAPEVRDTAIANIQNPVKALESLHKLAGVPVTKQAAAPESMGAPSDGTHAHVVTASEKPMKGSDKAFLSKLGLL